MVAVPVGLQILLQDENQMSAVTGSNELFTVRLPIFVDIPK